MSRPITAELRELQPGNVLIHNVGDSKYYAIKLALTANNGDQYTLTLGPRARLAAEAEPILMPRVVGMPQSAPCVKLSDSPIINPIFPTQLTGLGIHRRIGQLDTIGKLLISGEERYVGVSFGIDAFNVIDLQTWDIAVLGQRNPFALIPDWSVCISSVGDGERDIQEIAKYPLL